MANQRFYRCVNFAIFLLSLVSNASCELYNIAPNDSTNLCQNHPTGKCITLAEFVSSGYGYDNGNVSLFFLPGDHSLTQLVQIKSTGHVTLSGQTSLNNGSVLSSIRYEGTGGFDFQSAQSLHIENLKFIRSGQTVLNINKVQDVSLTNCHCVGHHVTGEKLHHSAIYISDGEYVAISESHFEGNHIHFTEPNTTVSQVKGGVMTITNISNLLVRDSCFLNNQVTGINLQIDGGAIYLEKVGNTSILNCNITNNSAFCYGCSYFGGIYAKGGAIASFVTGKFLIINSNFTSNSVGSISSQYYGSYGGAIFSDGGSISSSGSYYSKNRAANGGAIYTDGESISSSDSYYTTNFAYNDGGALAVKGKSLHCSNNHYTSNQANTGGAILAELNGNITVSSSFINNRASFGGAITIRNGTVIGKGSHFINNIAFTGGAVSLVGGTGSFTDFQSYYTNNSADNDGGAIKADDRHSIAIHGCDFENNTAGEHGGAIIIDGSAITSSNCLFTNNNAMVGGAISIQDGILYSESNHYIDNSASIGGAVWAEKSNVSSSHDHYTNNTAKNGGGLFAVESTAYFNKTSFTKNWAATQGAAIHHTSKMIEVKDSIISDNHANDNNIVHIITTTLICTGEFIFVNNSGSLHVINSVVEFEGNTTFAYNTGEFGGAITSIQSQITFTDKSKATISGNRATYGGGVSLTGSVFNVSTSVIIMENTATLSGGGIHAYQSEIMCKSKLKALHITDNTARSQNGGGIYAIASNVKIFHSYILLHNNKGDAGGGIFLEQNSKIYINKVLYYDFNSNQMILEFSNNFAIKGGAIYISDTTAAGILCERTNTGTEPTLASTECFIQTLKLNDERRIEARGIFFINNNASQSGQDIYGGLLDRCTVNPLAELAPDKYSGLEYVKAMVNFDDQPGPQISNSDLSNHISSDSVQVCFCDLSLNEYKHNCSIDRHKVQAKRGEMFRVTIAAVDQIEKPQSSTVIASFSSQGKAGRFKEGQTKQEVINGCTELEYNVYSEDPSAQIELYADGPCGNKGISKRALTINFLPCDCPIGFQQSQSNIECICVCDKRLEANIANCSLENETIEISTNVWIGYSNTANNTGFVIYPTCPFDYCVHKPVNVTLNDPNGADMQCAFNRSEKLCGKCEEDLSLVLGTSRCKKCSNTYLLLLIPFALAGIALVVFILILNLTVAIGTINGLIFYANILAANRSIFSTVETPNILTVFVSWLNLDLGIETCFYDGMDSYAKVLLQLIFPTYLIILIIIIIVLCEISPRFATLLGNRNPVATLCTLILLSYSKLIRTIIAALQYSFLDYPNGSREIVWLYDANVPYFTVSHIPRFILAFVIIILGSVYTVLLFFGQWFPRCSNRKFMKWTRNPKYNAFIDAYHAPFTPKHRYWVGLLLLARLTHYLVSAFDTGSSVTILSVACIVLALVSLKMINTRTHKNWLLDILDTSFLINLVFLSVSTYHVRESKGNQVALASISMSIAFMTFLVVLCLHFYKHILKGRRAWKKLTTALKGRAQAYSRRQMYPLIPLQEEPILDQDESDDDCQEPGIVSNQDPVSYTGEDNRLSTDVPRLYDPPIIRSPLNFDQLREPDLDILDPITTDDYRQPRRPPRDPEPAAVTFSVIDIREDHH